jgi:phosphoribosylformylglycinamidine cyclo-ligase
MLMSEQFFTYKEAGVQDASVEASLKGLIGWVQKTSAWQPSLVEIGYYAAVLQVAPNLGIAISTDGVGSKILVAEMMQKFDTIGIDCIAMNVNDILCVGAKPLALVDYIGVEKLKPEVLTQIGKGLYEGAKLANISIPAGEVAQLPEMLKGVEAGSGLDLVGTCIGTVAPDEIVIGEDLVPGDVIIGLASNGVHSNGLTLARQVLFSKRGFKVDSYLSELGCTLGEELLKPTAIYVKEVTTLWANGIKPKALIHITGGGFANLKRVKAPVDFHLQFLPEPPPIFNLIAESGPVSREEMYNVFNMGVGFCLFVKPEEVAKTLETLKPLREAWVIGEVIAPKQS